MPGFFLKSSELPNVTTKKLKALKIKTFFNDSSLLKSEEEIERKISSLSPSLTKIWKTNNDKCTNNTNLF